jgi:hypothetical protein
MRKGVGLGRLLVDGAGLLNEVKGLTVLAKKLIQRPQFDQAAGIAGMILPQRASQTGQGLQVVSLGRGVIGNITVNVCDKQRQAGVARRIRLLIQEAR